MQFVLTEEQGMLRDQVRALLAEHATPEALRALITAEQPWQPELWQAMAQLGVLGAAIPEQHGGVGLGLHELAVICEELGRTVAPVPFFSSICMAAEAIRIAGSAEQQARWLPALASGEAVATLAWAEGSGAPGSPIATTLTANRLNGRKWPVPDAGLASLCVVLANGADGLQFAVANLSRNAARITPLNGFDQLRHHATIDFQDTPCEPLTGAVGPEDAERLFQRLAVLAAFEQLGGTESALYMARDYAQERFIFGRKLASYQAIKHKLADILVMVELARGNALYAAGALTSSLPDCRAAAAAARISACQAYEQAARENLQVHGGIGFTWEANCHFHYRRARLLALNLGSTETWTDILIDALAVEPEAA